MIDNNKRNTSKEKTLRNLRFPYKARINQKKYRIVDDSGKSYGEYREKVNADKEIARLNKELWIQDLSIEDIYDE